MFVCRSERFADGPYTFGQFNNFHESVVPLV
jgi:hypothetical protein